MTKILKIGLIRDESARFDGYNWHDEYAGHFRDLGDEVVFLDFKKSNWREQVEHSESEGFLWRAWHRPDDRDDAKNKIQFIDQVLQMPIFPNWQMYWPYDNKVAQLFLMRELGIPHPNTFFSRDRDEIESFIQTADYPLISKCSEGACGDNVRKMENEKELREHVAEAFSDEGLPTYFQWVRQRGYIYLQEYLPLERDMRIITLGDDVIYSCWFECEDWKKFGSDVRITFDNIPEKAEELCKETSKKLGFHWAAYDVAEHEGKFYIFEFSSIFGFSFQKPLMERFGSRNANVLRQQAEYVHNLLGGRDE